MSNRKYCIGQKVALKAAIEHIPQMQIMGDLAELLEVSVRSVYNLINISLNSTSVIEDDRLEKIAAYFDVPVEELTNHQPQEVRFS